MAPSFSSSVAHFGVFSPVLTERDPRLVGQAFYTNFRDGGRHKHFSRGFSASGRFQEPRSNLESPGRHVVRETSRSFILFTTTFVRTPTSLSST